MLVAYRLMQSSRSYKAQATSVVEHAVRMIDDRTTVMTSDIGRAMPSAVYREVLEKVGVVLDCRAGKDGEVEGVAALLLGK